MVAKWYKTFGGKRVKVKIIDAKNTEGFLLNFGGGTSEFRVYNKIISDESTKVKHIWKSYPIAHSDLEIKIIGEAALYYKEDGTAYLDHSPDTLGWVLDDNQED